MTSNQTQPETEIQMETRSEMQTTTSMNILFEIQTKGYRNRNFDLD